MSESTIARNPAGDPLYRRMCGFMNHLTETYGPVAGETFLELLEACGPRGFVAEWRTELEVGVAVLERGEWTAVQARLDELTAA